ncbi:MAG: ABC transporter permease [Terracidiphilus sp.]
MSLQSRVRTWGRAVFRAGELRRQVTEELAFHIESYAAELERRGMLRDEALRRARAELGSVAARGEDCRRAWGAQWFDELCGDLHYALRILRKSPAFTLIAAGSLALAIGANSTIFAVGRQILFGRVTVPHPEQLRLLQWVGDDNGIAKGMWGEFAPGPGGSGTLAPIFSYPMYHHLRAANRELEDLVAYAEDSMNATVHGDAQRAVVVMVSGNFYQQMRVRVQIGRPIQPSDDRQSENGTVAVISDGLWQREFGRSPAVLGQIIRVNQQPMTIIGVNPRGFTGVKGAQESPDLVIPISMQPTIDPKGKSVLLTDPDFWWVHIVARAKPGVTEQTAQSALAARFEAAIRATMTVKPGQTLPRLLLVDGSRGLHMSDNFLSQPFYVLFVLTTLLLLLACANVANLLLARGAQRQREISVRMAMGAARLRVVRQLFTESLLLATLGGADGLLLSAAGRNVIPRLLIDPWEHAETAIPMDWRVFGFTILVTLTTALLFGLMPAWLAARNEVSSQLKENTHQATRRRKGWSGKSLVALQIALSTVLVIGAGVFLRTVMQLSSVDLGFQPDHVLMFDISPPRSRYQGGKDVLLHAQLEQKIAALPGVESVAPAWMPLAAGSMSNSDFLPEGQPVDPKGRTAEDINVVGRDYFHTMRIPMIAGRAFNAQDTATSLKVGIVNQALARKHFPNVNPIGKRFKTDGPKDGWITIVGICADTRYSQLRDDPPPVFYLPYVQQTDVGGMTYQIRTHLRAAALVPALRQIVQQADPDLPMIDIRTEREQMDANMQMERALATMTSAFGVLALVLASVGIYGIMAYTVAQRTNEIGIRLALGALPRQVRRMILKESWWLTAAGLAAGLAGALMLTRLVKSMLYGIAPYDSVTLGAAVLLLMGVALGASWIPARRAAGVDPMRALRHE